MATLKIPYQNLEFDMPDPGSMFRSEGGDRLYQIKEGKVYSYNPWELGGGDYQKGIAELKSKYGIDYSALPQRSASDYGSLQNLFPSSIGAGWAPFEGSWADFAPSVATPGGVTTRTIDPLNYNRAIDVAGNVPSGAAPDYLAKLLGTGGGAGGVYNATPESVRANYPYLQNEVASRAGGVAAGGQQRTLIDIANSRPDVLNTAKAQGGDPFTAGTPANTWLNDWWNSAGSKEYPGVTLSQPTGASLGGTGAGTGATGATTDPKDVIIQQLTNALKQGTASSGTLQSAYKAAQEAAGVSTMEGQIGTFDQEIQNFSSLLTDLENKVKSGQAIEEARLAPMDIIRGRQEAVAGAVEPTRQDLLKTLGLAQTGRAQLLETLDRKNRDILAEMGLKQQDLTNMKLDTQTIGNSETGYYQIITDKDGNVVKTTELVKGTGAEKWSEPYQLGGDWVQKNEKTGEVKVAVNVPVSSGTTNTWTTTLGIAAKDATKFNDEFQRQYERVLAGTYGTEGAREKAGQAMIAQFPQYADAIWKVIYGKADEGINAMFPNGYESQIKQSSTAQANILQWQYDLGVRPGMTQDQVNTILNKEPTLTDYFVGLEKTFQSYKDKNYSKDEVKNQWMADQSPAATSVPGPVQDLLNKVFGTNWLGQ